MKLFISMDSIAEKQKLQKYRRKKIKGMRRPEEKKKMKSDEISQLYQNIFFKNFEQSFI